MDNAAEIIVGGTLCLDLLPEMGTVPLATLASPGKMAEVGALRISTGGAVSNTGLALHRLGVKVRLLATVGDDLLGQVIIAFLKDRDETLAELISVRAGQSSSYSVLLSPENTDRIILHNSGTNASFGADQVDLSLVKQAKIFHLGYPTLHVPLIKDDGRALTAMFRDIQASGVVTSMDMSLPDPSKPSGRADWPVIFGNVLPHTGFFLPSIEEITFMMRRSDYDAWDGQVLPHITRDYLNGLAGELIDMGAAVVGFKLGELGLYLRTAPAGGLDRLAGLELDPARWADVELWAPIFEVEVAGTVGAGDSAYAGFLAAVLRGLDPGDAIRWACAVGACNVEAADSTSGVRNWEETAARLRAGWATSQRRLPGFAE
jgi:sugar/nucleoside kinase (ribokinase family)